MDGTIRCGQISNLTTSKYEETDNSQHGYRDNSFSTRRLRRKDRRISAASFKSTDFRDGTAAGVQGAFGKAWALESNNILCRGSLLQPISLLSSWNSFALRYGDALDGRIFIHILLPGEAEVTFQKDLTNFRRKYRQRGECRKVPSLLRVNSFIKRDAKLVS